MKTEVCAAIMKHHEPSSNIKTNHDHQPSSTINDHQSSLAGRLSDPPLPWHSLRGGLAGERGGHGEVGRVGTPHLQLGDRPGYCVGVGVVVNGGEWWLMADGYSYGLL